jgi:hypothetical protein
MNLAYEYQKLHVTIQKAHIHRLFFALELFSPAKNVWQTNFLQIPSVFGNILAYKSFISHSLSLDKSGHVMARDKHDCLFQKFQSLFPPPLFVQVIPTIIIDLPIIIVSTHLSFQRIFLIQALFEPLHSLSDLIFSYFRDIKFFLLHDLFCKLIEVVRNYCLTHNHGLISDCKV